MIITPISPQMDDFPMGNSSNFFTNDRLASGLCFCHVGNGKLGISNG